MGEGGRDRKFANTLARGLSVLRVFRVRDDGLTHGQIVERTGLSPATITRLTYTLKELGYLSQNGNLLRLGPASLAMAGVATASTTLLDLADAPMQALASRSGTLTMMTVHDGTSMALVRTWRPQGVASIWLEAGNRVPLLGSAAGQGFVAALTPTQFGALDPEAGLGDQRETGKAQLRALGFTYVPEARRYSRRVSAVARPFHASEFGAPVVFGCGATPEALSERRICEVVGPALREAMQDLERKGGGPRALDIASREDAEHH